VGESGYPVTVEARYSQYHQGRRKAPSGLPAQWAATDDYSTMLFQVGNLVPVPPAMTVRVTPPESAP